MRKLPEINSGSMADVAFTLLIFFLVSTTLAVDKGVKVRLPPFVECETQECKLNISDPNLLFVSILPNHQILVESIDFDMQQLKKESILFLTNNGINPNYSRSIDEAVILIELHPDADFETYLEAMSSIRSAYNELRTQKSRELFNMNYDQLDHESAQTIRELIPMQLAEQMMDIN